jgi:hypothetical protein
MSLMQMPLFTFTVRSSPLAEPETTANQPAIDDTLVETFLKNAHALCALTGEKWGTIDEHPNRLSMSTDSPWDCNFTVGALQGTALDAATKETAIHLALSALSDLVSRGDKITQGDLKHEASNLAKEGLKLNEIGEFVWASGEM